MFKKMMKHLTNNPGLKVISILIAVMLWLIVVNYDDPEKRKDIFIPVQVIGQEELEKMGMVWELESNSRESSTVTIRVIGKRSIIDKLDSSAFRATADLMQMMDTEQANKKRLPIIVEQLKYKNDVEYDQKVSNLTVYLEERSDDQKSVICETTGHPAEGYAIGETTVSPNLLSVSGPESLVSQVARVVATVNVEGLSADSSVSVTPTIYDANGNVMEDPRLRLSQDKVTVNVRILGTKSVKVICKTSGEPAEGYFFAGLEYAPETVTIMGEPGRLNGIHEIVIPGEAIDLTGATADVENSIDINPYLEDGISLVNSDENKIAVKALIEGLETKNVEVPIASLEVLHAPERYQVAYDVTNVQIPVRGKREELTRLTAEQVKATIDLAGMALGTHDVEVRITVDEKFQVMGTVTLKVHIREPGSEPGNGGGTGTGPGSGTGQEGGAGTGD